MHLFRQAPILALVSISSALNILLNNDDSFVSANIREFYKALKAAGHKVLLVAPAVNQSGKGGTVSSTDSRYSFSGVLIKINQTVFDSNANLTGPAEFNYLPAGSPSVRLTDHHDNLRLTKF
jgi:5'-nucleotidase